MDIGVNVIALSARPKPGTIQRLPATNVYGCSDRPRCQAVWYRNASHWGDLLDDTGYK